ncbi:MAG: Hsp20/alpha crystallin family protein [Clostridiales bacterium]|nr:Hsp20/alpha crystallin family protein [Clostridiales bacterium]
MAGLVPYRRGRNHLVPDDFFSLFRGDDFFRDFFNTGWNFGGNGNVRIDVQDKDDEYLMEAELPGVNKDQIKIDIHNGVLTLSANENWEDQREQDNYIYRERRVGRIQRSFSLENVKEDAVTAEYKDGILAVHLPKADPKRNTRRSVNIQ